MNIHRGSQRIIKEDHFTEERPAQKDERIATSNLLVTIKPANLPKEGRAMEYFQNMNLNVKQCQTMFQLENKDKLSSSNFQAESIAGI